MEVHASPAELPELRKFLAAFRVRFRRLESAKALERYTTGLLTELPNKNCDTLAQAIPGTSEQRLQEFLTNMQWDEADLNMIIGPTRIHAANTLLPPPAAAAGPIWVTRQLPSGDCPTSRPHF
jgi:hypothetical protein